MRNPTAAGGAQIFNKFGIDKTFISDMYNKYAGYGSKLGLNQSVIDNAYNSITSAMHGNTEQRSGNKFNSKKYTKV